MDNPLSKVLANAPPPPPPEVKIRTMRSDIESMMNNGGGAPTFRDVAVSGLSLEGYKSPTSAPTPMPDLGTFSVPAAPASLAPAAAPAAPGALSGPAEKAVLDDSGSGNHIIPIVIVAVVAIIAIAVVGYFAYTIFAK